MQPVPYETYKARRSREARFIAEHLEAAGATILTAPSPGVAPLAFEIMTPYGDRLSLLCYAFSANKYSQKGRPKDEHRLQVKYGSNFHRYHRIYISPRPNHVTLMFGIHFESGIMVAVDPKMHEITWFSKSIEFKDHHIERILSSGWHGWEREQVHGGRRKTILPDMSLKDEVLLGLTPDRLLEYIDLERLATGADPGERLLLIDAIASGRAIDGAYPHPLEVELGMKAREILNMINSARRLKVAVRGASAEAHLEEYVRQLPDVTSVAAIDEDGRPDLAVCYKNREPVYIECKNVLRRLQNGRIKVDFQKTRASKSDPCSRYYRPSQFQILGACLHPVTESWEFRFCLTSQLHPHPKCEGHLYQVVYVEGDRWTRPLPALLDACS